jgi:chromosome segregation ATPase
MEAIVVNSEATSFECIQYLRENKIRSQLFLPLDTLVTQVRFSEDSCMTLKVLSPLVTS